MQDAIIVALMATLLAISAQALWRLWLLAFVEHAPPLHLLSQVALILILTELFRLLIFYLREHRISVALMVEVAIVSILRELMLRSVQEVGWESMLANSLLLVVLGGLLALERWFGRLRKEARETDAG
ncbi:MAG: phosphate-starvation-inducible PsiE family protein [Gemmataceae bacterium]|nr:phosphate-starvation-inducible PsiE family protein [Gemmataceae bacterium]